MVKCNNLTLFDMTRFIVLETTVAIFTMMMVYLVVALIIYEWKKPKNNIISLRHLSDLNRSLQFALKMRLLTLLAVLLVLGRFVCENYELLAQYTGVCYDYCNIIVKIKVTLTAVALYCIYSFLWMRQQFFYAEPAVQHLSRPLIRALSWGSLGLLTLALLIGTVLFLVTRFYKMTERGCLNHHNTIPPVIPWIFLGTATVLSQLILFALFVYPLLQHKSQLDASSCSNFSSFAPLIKRVAMAAAICIISDIIALLLIVLVKDQDEIIPTLAYDISLVVNVICVMATFSDWWDRLAAPLCCSRFRLLSNEGKGSTTNKNKGNIDSSGTNCTSLQGSFQATTFPEQNFFPNYLTISEEKGNASSNWPGSNHRRHAWK